MSQAALICPQIGWPLGTIWSLSHMYIGTSTKYVAAKAPNTKRSRSTNGFTGLDKSSAFGPSCKEQEKDFYSIKIYTSNKESKQESHASESII